MKRLTGVLLLACAALASGADDKKDDAAKGDLKKLQGTWMLVSMEIDGKTAPAEQTKHVKSVVEGNKVTVSFKDEVKAAATFTVDASKKPKAMDATAIMGPNKGKTSLAIYDIDGDTFKICSSEGKKRPTEFAAKEGSGISLMVWKRAKE